jgi:hypothetical protein
MGMAFSLGRVAAYPHRMGEIVNLNKARKARAKAEAAADAAANRAKHGRSKAEKTCDAQAEARRRALLDGAKKED